jgi:hypothetical protein
MQLFDGYDMLETDSKGIIKPLMIKNYCLKLTVDRLGAITLTKKTTMEYPNDRKHISFVNESSAKYSSSKKITISQSFGAAEDSRLKYWAGLTPEQRFADFDALMSRFFTFNAPIWLSKKIILDT